MKAPSIEHLDEKSEDWAGINQHMNPKNLQVGWRAESLTTLIIITFESQRRPRSWTSTHIYLLFMILYYDKKVYEIKYKVILILSMLP